MLKNTLILPETNARLAAKMLGDAIDALDVILMLIFGKNKTAEQAVKWADQLCEKTRISESLNMRRVVWIREPDRAALKQILEPIVGAPPYPRAVVLNFHDTAMGNIPVSDDDTISPLVLERLFVQGFRNES